MQQATLLVMNFALASFNASATMLLVLHNDMIICAVILTSRTPLCRRLCLSLAMNMIRWRPAAEYAQNGQTNAILYPSVAKQYKFLQAQLNKSKQVNHHCP